MSRSSALIAVIAIAFTLIAPAISMPSTPVPAAPAGKWVVESVHYSGPRGQNLPGGSGEHFVTCIPEGDLALDRTQREHWREIHIPAEHAYDETFDTGVPCPDGKIRLSSDEGR